MATSLERYLSTALWSSIAVGILSAAVGYLAIRYVVGLPVIFAASLALALMAALGYACHRVFLYYPSAVARGRAIKIDAMLSHATAFMFALSKGGIETIEIFRLLSRQKGEYGEISTEAGAIVRGVEYLGYGPLAAIRDVARTTPSAKLRDFLGLLASVLETGADLPGFFAEKCRQYYSEATSVQKRFLDTLGLLAEVYVVLLGLGPLLAIIILLLMSMMGGSFYTGPIFLIVYLLVPFASAFFITLISRLSPPVLKKKYIRGKRLTQKVTTKTPAEEELLDVLLKKRRIERIKRVLRNPFGIFLESPSRILFVSTPAAIVFAAVHIHMGLAGTSTAFFALIISLTPFALFYELRVRRIEKIADAMPDFLVAFSSAVASGLPPARAMKTVSQIEFGPLSSELARVNTDVEWGKSFADALSGFEERVRSGLITRTLTLVKRASEASEEIGDVLAISAMDASTEKTLKQERRGLMITYTIIVYLSFAVFLLTVYALSTSFLPVLPVDITGPSPLGPLPAVGIVTLKLIFFHAALIQGLCAGLIAGEMETGTLMGGLKHSLLMIALAYFVFTMFVL